MKRLHQIELSELKEEKTQTPEGATNLNHTQTNHYDTDEDQPLLPQNDIFATMTAMIFRTLEAERIWEITDTVKETFNHEIMYEEALRENIPSTQWNIWLRQKITQHLSENLYQYNESDDDDLKLPLINDNTSNEKKPHNTHRSCVITTKQLHPMFYNIIPYLESILSDTQLNVLFPFLQEPSPPLNLSRENYLFDLVICLFCVFSTLIQLWFVIDGPTPFKWLSLGFFLLTQLMIVAAWAFWCYIVIDAYEFTTPITALLVFTLILLSMLLFPTIPVAIFFLVRWMMLNISGVDYTVDFFFQSTLWMSCLGIVLVAMFQAFPQLILMTVMFAQYDELYGVQLQKHPTNVVHCSFWSSVIVLLLFCIVFASVFEDTYVYLLNVMWLCLDCAILLFILSAVFYDDTTMIICIVDCIVMLFPFVFAPLSSVDNSYSVLSVACVECCIVIFCPLILLLFGLWTFPIICFASQILYCNIFPFCINFCINCKAIKYDSKWRSYWYRYRLFKWIRNGRNKQEKDLRLCCVNMIILDKYYSDSFNELKQNIRRNIRHGCKAVNKCKSLIRRSNHNRFKMNFKQLPSAIRCSFSESVILRSINVYFITRIIHIFMPIMIALYIGYKENWNLNTINFMMKYLGFICVVLYVGCIIGFIVVWISMYYHRLIIPFDKNFRNTDFGTYVKNVANCYLTMTVTEIVTRSIGNRDIAVIVLQYIVENDENEDKDNDTLKKKKYKGSS